MRGLGAGCVTGGWGNIETSCTRRKSPRSCCVNHGTRTDWSAWSGAVGVFRTTRDGFRPRRGFRHRRLTRVCTTQRQSRTDRCRPNGPQPMCDSAGLRPACCCLPGIAVTLDPVGRRRRGVRPGQGALAIAVLAEVEALGVSVAPLIMLAKASCCTITMVSVSSDQAVLAPPPAPACAETKSEDGGRRSTSQRSTRRQGSPVDLSPGRRIRLPGWTNVANGYPTGVSKP